MGLFSSKPRSVTTTTTQVPWEQQIPYLKELFSEAQNLYDTGQLGQIAGFSPTEMTGREMAMNAAAQIGGMMPGAMNAWNFLLNAPNIQSNPILDQYVQAALRPLNTQLMTQILPSLTSGASQAEGVGGSRQGVLEANALNDWMTAGGDITSKIMNTAYGQGLQASQAALGMMPMMTAMQTAPAEIYRQLGAEERLLEQARLDQAQNALRLFQSFIGGNYGGSTIQQQPYLQPSPFMQGLGLAAMALPLVPGLGAIGGIIGPLIASAVAAKSSQQSGPTSITV